MSLSLMNHFLFTSCIHWCGQYGTIAVDGSLVQTYIFWCVLVSRLFIYRFRQNIPSGKDFICKKCYDYHHLQMSTTGDVINICNRVANFFQPLMPNSSHFTAKRPKKCQKYSSSQATVLWLYHHHRIYFPIQTQQKSQKIAIKSEGCQRRLTAHWLAAQVKNKFSTNNIIIL